MNPQILLGLIAFLVWATFSTWYYISYLWNGDQIPSVQKTELPTEQVQPVEESAEKKAINPDTLELNPETVKEIAFKEAYRTFTFEKNTTTLTDPTSFLAFGDSLQAAWPEVELQVKITGYTCNLGTKAYNQKLALDRATFVKEQLKALTSSNASVELEAAGEKQPLAPNTNENNRAKNRRVTIKISSKS